MEFVTLAIPLFIPIFIYLGHFSALSDSHASLRTLARESARAFVTSSNDEIAFEVSRRVVEQGGKLLGYNFSSPDTEISIECSERPCISPNSKIAITLKILTPQKERVSVTAVEYVSPWA